MSFFSDLGGFVNDVHHMSEEIDAVKHDVLSNVKDVVLNVESQGNEIAAELRSNTESLAQSAKDTVDDIRPQN